MIIVSLSEKLEIEKRISITPEIVKKYTELGFEVKLEKNMEAILDIVKMNLKIMEQNLRMMKKNYLKKQI